MTARGPLPLNAYAGGGIANSPQVALFGEGRMNEAYVPLPDGRRIPVAMQGTPAPANDSAGGGHTFVTQVDARGATDPAEVEMRVQRAIARARPGIIQDSARTVQESRKRNPQYFGAKGR
jgi:hypothetical protein